jgi:hypothetical protein
MVDYVGIEPNSSQIILFDNEENLQDEESLFVSDAVQRSATQCNAAPGSAISTTQSPRIDT